MYKLIVKNQDKKMKKDVHKIEMQKLPIDKEYVQQYLSQCLVIEWKGNKIEKVSLNEKGVDLKKIKQV